jgi:formylglycine-generating enzyme required for sulfatase activity
VSVTPLAGGVLALAACSVFALPRAPETDIEFVKISPGAFMMGCSPGDTDCKDDERPLHRVQITKPFYIGKYEVTQAQWEAVMGSNPSSINGADRPVEMITKTEAQDFVDRLNSRLDGYRYRLPTEAEWEYTARAGAASPYYGKLDEIAWFAANSGDETHPVGRKKPNAWGLHDMLGNVREWVSDSYAATYYSNSPSVDPAGLAAAAAARGRPLRGAVNNLPVMRGGGFDTLAPFVRVSDRYHYYGPTLRVSDLGVRIVRERSGGEQ